MRGGVKENKKRQDNGRSKQAVQDASRVMVDKTHKHAFSYDLLFGPLLMFLFCFSLFRWSNWTKMIMAKKTKSNGVRLSILLEVPLLTRCRVCVWECVCGSGVNWSSNSLVGLLILVCCLRLALFFSSFSWPSHNFSWSRRDHHIVSITPCPLFLCVYCLGSFSPWNARVLPKCFVWVWVWTSSPLPSCPSACRTTFLSLPPGSLLGLRILPPVELAVRTKIGNPHDKRRHAECIFCLLAFFSTLCLVLSIPSFGSQTEISFPWILFGCEAHHNKGTQRQT